MLAFFLFDRAPSRKRVHISLSTLAEKLFFFFAHYDHARRFFPLSILHQLLLRALFINSPVSA